MVHRARIGVGDTEHRIGESSLSIRSRKLHAFLRQHLRRHSQGETCRNHPHRNDGRHPDSRRHLRERSDRSDNLFLIHSPHIPIGRKETLHKKRPPRHYASAVVPHTTKNYIIKKCSVSFSFPTVRRVLDLPEADQQDLHREAVWAGNHSLLAADCRFCHPYP